MALTGARPTPLGTLAPLDPSTRSAAPTLRAMDVRAWGLLVGVLAASAATACVGSDGSSSGAGSGTDIEPATLVGTTEQAQRLRIDRVGEREVSLRFPAECHPTDNPDINRSVALHRHRLKTSVADDGEFTVDESYVENGTDGDEEHVDVRIEGDFAGTAGQRAASS